MHTKIFSLPLNPKLSEKQFEEYIAAVIKYKHLINDIYFTAYIDPFNLDAMGEIFVGNDDRLFTIKTALYVQQLTGVPVSATFNNIHIPPTQENLDKWIQAFGPLYNAGITNITIPFTHWVATGCIQHNFPALYIKNTILRKVTKPADVINLIQTGFNYINLDRNVMRDADALISLKKAKTWLIDKGYNVKYSLLSNEGCIGNCSMMDEHFHYNCTRGVNDSQYFHNPISRVSCPKWDYHDPAIHLKTANLPPWKKDWEEMLSLYGIDVFKMHGRESVSRLFESIDIIRRWDNDEVFLFDTFEEYVKDNNLIEKPIDVWRNKIKNCKFDCWNCDYCERIVMKNSKNTPNPLVSFVVDCIEQSGNPQHDIDIPGLTSPRVQELIRLLASSADVYCEIGSHVGATATAALVANIANVICVDNWKTPIAPENEGLPVTINSKEDFIKNIDMYRQQSIVKLFTCDMFDVPVKKLSKIDIFFYDGPHDLENTSKVVQHYSSAFSDQVVCIFDDANWEGVIDGALDGIAKTKYNILYQRKLINAIEDKNMWWNGLFIVVLDKETVS